MNTTTQNRLHHVSERAFTVYYKPEDTNAEAAARRALDYLLEHGRERVPFSLGGYTCLQQEDGRLVVLPDLS